MCLALGHANKKTNGRGDGGLTIAYAGKSIEVAAATVLPPVHSEAQPGSCAALLIEALTGRLQFILIDRQLTTLPGARLGRTNASRPRLWHLAFTFDRVNLDKQTR
ncbi:hypothetical protein KM043_005886 [Ampulex compressa]|nr:hypothetical protein KM043_005886 [Ampulex compressa]